MSYSITISRSEENGSIQESAITLEEWLEYILRDNELERPSENDLNAQNRKYYQEKKGYCEWTAHSKFKEPFARPWFDYYNGTIISENADNETMIKIIAIAAQLRANVIDQDGQVHEGSDEF